MDEHNGTGSTAMVTGVRTEGEGNSELFCAHRRANCNTCLLTNAVNMELVVSRRSRFTWFQYRKGQKCRFILTFTGNYTYIILSILAQTVITLWPGLFTNFCILCVALFFWQQSNTQEFSVACP